MQTITLYRTIGWEELSIILSEGRVEGRFQTEMKENSYLKSFGKVICTFTEPRYFDYVVEAVAFLKIVVPVDRIISKGEGSYKFYNGFHKKLLFTTLEEVFISYYLLSEIEISGYSLYHNSMMEELQNGELGEIFEGLLEGLSYEQIKEEYSVDTKEISTFKKLLPHLKFIDNLTMKKPLYTLFENKGNDVIEYKIYSNVTEENLPQYGYVTNKESICI